MALIHSQFMTPDWLNQRLNLNADVVEDKELDLDTGSRAGQQLLSIDVKDILFDDEGLRYDLNLDTDLTVAIDVAFEHFRGATASGQPRADSETMGSLNFLLTDVIGGRSRRGGSANNAIGFRIEGDLAKYPVDGPYRGVEGDIKGEFELDTLQGPEPCSQKRFPQIFKMLFKPNSKWGACYTAIGGGHLCTATYGKSIRIDHGFCIGLYSDEDTRPDVYNINYINLSIYEGD